MIDLCGQLNNELSCVTFFAGIVEQTVEREMHYALRVMLNNDQRHQRRNAICVGLYEERFCWTSVTRKAHDAA